MKRIYLDHAAATPADTEVLKTFLALSKKYTGNAHALHREGVVARTALDGARAKIAHVLGAHADEVVFTSGATESNNIALAGVVRAARASGFKNPRIVISAIEHPSVREVARALAREGVAVDMLGVSADGLVDTHALRKLLTSETVLVSVMYANNEIGTVEPIREIAKEVRHARTVNGSVYPYFHTDAAQALNYLDVNVLRLGVDLMTLSSGKTYGPYGVGALFVKRGVKMESVSHGGSHESGRRPGTEAVPLACAFAHAVEIAEKIKAKESARVMKLRNLLAEKILKQIPDVTINGDMAQALPNMLSVTIPGIESETLVIYLDARGVAVSGKSACTSSVEGLSHVILALGKAGAEQAGVIRFSLGRQTIREDVIRAAKEFSDTVAFLRKPGVMMNEERIN